ncbi:ImmA/IrrE family metallo-endopeptidase [Acinetobacter sp. B5B]|uniref:ImmA/IrrE family metallo-endopeptidase n=1 Tax=Acinetobacter baretiae TaxID=2605383 RepID=UPI0018C251B9|nr:ImmA/IrrE family metallo-endopeptidase [Acinetobacter baretiae]MBF7683976.1 ImmA/IrrE family metallo-endopeptidase [Acinetobacter baretiae]
MPNNSKIYIEKETTQIRQDYGFTNHEIDLFVLGQELGIDIQTQKSTSHGISGALIRNGNDFIIYYSSYINNFPYQRFSIAHEFGHYFLPEHPENIFNKQGVHFSSAGNNSTKNRFEKEADYFSTCLLMPKFLFEKEMYKYNDGLEAIKNLAATFNTSLISTAIRYIELTETPAMLVISSKGVIDAVFDTKELRKFGNKIYIKNKHLPSQSVISFGSSKKDVFLHDWIDTNLTIKAIEENITLGSYEKMLTVITTSTLYEEVEERQCDIWDPPSFK